MAKGMGERQGKVMWQEDDVLRRQGRRNRLFLGKAVA